MTLSKESKDNYLALEYEYSGAFFYFIIVLIPENDILIIKSEDKGNSCNMNGGTKKLNIKIRN